MWKLREQLSAFAKKLRKNWDIGAGEPPRETPRWPARDSVRNGFRFILGREPGNESVVDEHVLIRSFAEFRRALLGSDEFKDKYKSMFPGMYGHPSLSMARPTIVLIHLQKTGGTSLRVMLEQQFASERRCPIRDDKLHLLSMAELGHYDFFSGHFDRTSLQFIPRTDIKTVALFREPSARLVSFYRFLKAHPTRDEFADDPLIRSANELSAEEFFEKEEMRAHVGVYNHYLIALGGSYAWFEHTRTTLNKDDFSRALGEAKKQIRALTALGITERFSRSSELIWRTLNLGSMPPMESADITDRLPEVDTRFQRVDRVAMTPRLAGALADLTAYDDELYQFAVREFDRRCAELGISST